MLTPPNILHHYTTQVGLLGILSKNTLWATKINYLNDSNEYQLAFGLANAVFQRLIAGETNAKKRTKIETLIGNLKQVSKKNVCVCSFTSHGDLLSQWRAYAGDIAGFSLGFHTTSLRENADANGFVLAKCIYDAQEQKNQIESLIEATLAEDFNTDKVKIHPTDHQRLIIQPTGGTFAKNFARLASILKDQGFREEDEWRLVSKKGISDADMDFRPGKSMLIPYASFKLGEKEDKYLHSLTVGPTPHKQLSKDSVKSLLGCLKFQCVEVLSSSIPYRAW